MASSAKMASKMSIEQEIVRTSLRLHKPLYDRLAKAADARGLTMHAEILARLESSFELEEAGGAQAYAMGELAGSVEGSVAVLQSRIKEMSDTISALTTERANAEPIFNFVLDAKGRPIGWPEIAAHVYRTAKAAGLNTVSLRTAVFNAAAEEDDEKSYGEFARLVRYYQEQTRKHKDEIRADEE